MADKIEVKDESWTMPGNDEGSIYEVAFRTRHLAIGTRKVGEGAFTRTDTGEKADAIRIRVQATRPLFSEGETFGPFTARTPTHASALVPAPMLVPVLCAALVWCLGREQGFALTGQVAPEEVN